MTALPSFIFSLMYSGVRLAMPVPRARAEGRHLIADDLGEVLVALIGYQYFELLL
jgi:hypothetical protein